jgi:flagellar hook-basal body complex protein FliE
MQGSKTSETSSLISPFDLAQGKASLVLDPHSLGAQMQLVQNSMEKIQEQIQNPNLKLKPSQKHLVKNKLQSANKNIQEVASKMGGEIYAAEGMVTKEPPAKPAGAFSQFLDYLTDGLTQLESAKQQVALLGQKPALSPADFLLMQVKLNKATQELEFTNSLLGNAISGFKQIMNIQL